MTKCTVCKNSLKGIPKVPLPVACQMYKKVASMLIDQQAMKDNLSRRGRFSNWIRVTLQEQVPGGNQEEEKLGGLNDEDFTWLLEIRA